MVVSAAESAVDGADDVTTTYGTVAVVVWCNFDTIIFDDCTKESICHPVRANLQLFDDADR